MGSVKTNIPTLANGATRVLGLLKGSDRQIWRYDGAGRYLPDGMEEAEQYVKDELTTVLEASDIHGLRTVLKAGRVTLDLDAANSVEYLNTRSGLYEWATRTLHPHDPAYVNTYIVPHYLSTDATCPRIDAFLERALPDPGERGLFWQWAGYALRPGNPYKKALILSGQKDTGKTVAVHLLKHLLGPENTSAVSLQDLGDNRFAPANLVGKLANIADDLSATRINESGRVKAITGGGSVQCEHKGQRSFQAVIGAKLIFTANELPGTGDMSDAWFDRWHLISFNQVVPRNEQDTGIWAAITTPEELEGALQKAIAAAHGLLSRGGFEVPASVAAAVTEYQSDADSVFGWLRDECEVGAPGSKLYSSRLDTYNAFIHWAEAERRGVMGAPKFYRRLRAAGVEDVDRGSGNRGFRMQPTRAKASTGATGPLF